MEYSPPPLFKQGPSAIARLVVFVALALILLVLDARYKTLEKVREVIGTGLYPLQRVLVPRDAVRGSLDFLTSGYQLRTENAALQASNLKLSLIASQTAQLEAENRHLRDLLQLAQRPGMQATPSEIQYDARDPFTQKVIIDQGTRAGIQLGAPVVSEGGVLGQVTRIYALQAEVTLITDKDQAIPVQVVRTGLRSVIYGTPRGEALDLRFVPSSADLQVGDQLVTSGLDGVFPPGLPVAKVAQIDHQADTAFARVICTPVAQIHGPRQLLVLHYQPQLLPPPAEFESGSSRDPGKNASKKGAKPDAPKAQATDGASSAAARPQPEATEAAKEATKGAKESTKGAPNTAAKSNVANVAKPASPNTGIAKPASAGVTSKARP
jgi:rod shape-determining protein MreC